MKLIVSTLNFWKKNLVVLPIIVLFLLSCYRESQENFPKIPFKPNQTIPDQYAENIVVDFVDTNFLKARLRAKRAMVYFPLARTELAESIKVEFFSKARNRLASTLVADSAVIDDRTKDMFAFGNVIVVADSPRTILKTSFLQWKNSEQKIETNQYVEIISPVEEIRGWGFESDLTLTNYKIFKVSGVRK